MEDKEYCFTIIYDNLEEYKKSFFIRFENANEHYLNFLEKEKEEVLSILKKNLEKQGSFIQASLDEDGSTKNFFKICGSKTYKILQDFKTEILKLKNVDETSFFDVASDVLEDNDIGYFIVITDNELIQNNDFDFLINYLRDFLHTFYLPELLPEKNFILKFIEIEIDKIQNQIISKKNKEEPKPLTDKQVQKIGLLIRSGIVDFLKEKNPNITTNQIAGFIDLLSIEPLKKTSINPHLSKNNSKYAIQNQQDKEDLDFILKKFGISPQS